jgi:glycosyltransferase involved in cell wall biosynthesis
MFPNPVMPHFGVFVLRRLKAAQKHANITIAHPVPYFPAATLLPKYKFRKDIPDQYNIEGMDVSAIKYLSIPGICKPLDGYTMYQSIFNTFKHRFDFDVIDAQLAFPDGYAAALLSAKTKRPFVVTLRGHDINVLPQLPVRGPMVRSVLSKASRVMGVSQSLINEAIKLGADPNKCVAVPNGVDIETFQPMPRELALKTLKLDLNSRYILSVGHLIERKGHHLIIEAIAQLRKDPKFQDVRLIIVGSASVEGNYEPEIKHTIRQHNLENYVILAGAIHPDQLSLWYGASHGLCLASSKEGWANVLLESLACGRAVLATKVWGTPEVIVDGYHGILIDRSVEQIHTGIIKLLRTEWNENILLQRAKSFTWENSGLNLANNYLAAISTQSN